MIDVVQGAFADTAFWIALLIRQDEHHSRAQACARLVSGQITTTTAVLLETGNALSKPSWRPYMIALMERIQHRDDIIVIEVHRDIFERGWNLYRQRPDKGWSLTDCISFEVMKDLGLRHALTSDEHFRQAGFIPLLLKA